MAGTGESETYTLGSRKSLPWWAFPVFLLLLFIPFFFRVAFLDYEPPSGWAAAVAAAFVASALLFGIFWLGQIHGRQHVIIRPDGLLVAVPFRCLIPFEAIESVTCVDYSKPLWEYGFSTFLRRKLIPIWELPPNVDIRFKEPVRLNLYPFRWFTLIQLAVDRPDEFVKELSRKLDRLANNPRTGS